MKQEAALSKGPVSGVAVGVQVVVLILTGIAIGWGCCMIYVALHPGDSGEFGGFSVLFAAAIDIPLGLASLLVGLTVKKGYQVLRWASVILSAVALALPFLTKAAWQGRFITR